VKVDIRRINASELGPIDGQLAVVSDVHIRDPGDMRTKLFVEMIDKMSLGKIDWFVLNGDIFDFFFGGSDYFFQKFESIFASLERLAKTGTKIVYLEGNHELGLAERGTYRGVRYSQAFEDEIRLDSGEVIFINHGDLMSREVGYRIFRWVVKSKPVILLAKILPQRRLDQFADWLARLSRSKDKYRDIRHEPIIASAQKWLQAKPDGHGIFGHFHIPYELKRSNASGLILSVKSWDEPSLLIYKNKQFQRIYFA
jgi:UDP-2,3-diacylglucosamine hydrolase